jgi:hypothetical protein
MQRSAIFTLALALGLAIPMIGTQAAPAEAAVRIYIPAPVVVVGGTNRQHTDRDDNRREERAEAQERREARERRIAYERRITYERREQREERHEYQTARWAPVRRDHRGD